MQTHGEWCATKIAMKGTARYIHACIHKYMYEKCAVRVYVCACLKIYARRHFVCSTTIRTYVHTNSHVRRLAWEKRRKKRNENSTFCRWRSPHPVTRRPTEQMLATQFVSRQQRCGRCRCYLCALSFCAHSQIRELIRLFVWVCVCSLFW